MKMKINKALIEHFKGVAEREIEFSNDVTDIRGYNGSGKSTIASAVYFVLADCDYQLNNKPMVQPLNDSEVKPHVKLWLDIDGREITVEKTQRTAIKVDENSGKTTATTTNTYAINDVPKSYRDFTEYFNDLGIDLDKFLILSHPDAFTKDNSAKGRESMRKALFEMASDKSDLDIVKAMNGVSELTIALGEGYKLDEIKAMNAATIKKIETENGKKNELLDARIQGLIEGKVDYNLAELTSRELELESRIENIKEEIKILADISNEIRISELKNKIAEIQNKAVAEFYEKRKEHMAKHNELIDRYRDVETVINTANKVIFENEKKIENCNTLLESLRIDYDSVFNKQYDGSSTCPVCKQELPKLMLADAKANFEADKARNLNSIKASAASIHKDIDDKEKLIADAKATISRVTPSLEMLKEQLAEWESISITEPRLEDIPEIAPLKAEIKALEEETVDSSQERFDKLDKALASAETEIIEVQGKQKALENNEIIDEKISALREKKIADETYKAKAEKVLYQITEFEKHKNNLLTDEINSHFDLVDWRLFETQKNGEYKACCYPTYEGKQIDVDTNTALSVAMRLDIATSLQKFNDFYVPIFIDKAESLDSQTRRDIASHKDAQIIWLTVNDEELTIVKGE